MEGNMTRFFGFALLFAAISEYAFALPAVPEIDASSGMSALALLGGGLLLLRSRRSGK
jgi:hypothetical protein